MGKLSHILRMLATTVKILLVISMVLSFNCNSWLHLEIFTCNTQKFSHMELSLFMVVAALHGVKSKLAVCILIFIFLFVPVLFSNWPSCFP